MVAKKAAAKVEREVSETQRRTVSVSCRMPEGLVRWLDARAEAKAAETRLQVSRSDMLVFLLESCWQAERDR